jgi:hypothetical protein
MLDRDDAVGTVRDDRTGGDRNRRAGLDPTGERRSCRGLPDDLQHAGEICRTRRKTVHRRARERREIDLGPYSLGDDPSPSRADRHELRRKRPSAREHLRLRLLEGE